MEAERRVDEVRRDLAKVERAAREVPERPLATDRLVDGTEWLHPAPAGSGASSSRRKTPLLP